MVCGCLVGLNKRKKSECFFEVVEDRSADTLLRIITEKIRPGSIIYSDCWRAYSQIPNLPGYSYKHATVNHSREFTNKENGACTNHIEATWHALKSRKAGKGDFAKTLISSYFAEFIYRRKFLESAGDPFLLFIQEGVTKVYNKSRAVCLL